MLPRPSHPASPKTLTDHLWILGQALQASPPSPSSLLDAAEIGPLRQPWFSESEWVDRRLEQFETIDLDSPSVYVLYVLEGVKAGLAILEAAENSGQSIVMIELNGDALSEDATTAYDIAKETMVRGLWAAQALGSSTIWRADGEAANWFVHSPAMLFDDQGKPVETWRSEVIQEVSLCAMVCFA